MSIKEMVQRESDAKQNINSRNNNGQGFKSMYSFNHN
jgi:hypothetical protein